MYELHHYIVVAVVEVARVCLEQREPVACPSFVVYIVVAKKNLKELIKKKKIEQIQYNVLKNINKLVVINV